MWIRECVYAQVCVCVCVCVCANVCVCVCVAAFAAVVLDAVVGFGVVWHRL